MLLQKKKSPLLIGALIASVAMTLSLGNSARAALLPPGGTVVPNVTPSPAGAALVASTGAVGFISSPGGKITGTLVTSVYINDPSNPFGPFALTFTYLVSNDITSTGSIDRFVANDFTGVFTDAAFDPGIGGPVAPDSADRSVPGDTVGFNYPQLVAVINPGQSSYLMVVFTSATNFKPVTDVLIDSEVATVPSLGPDVPEPATLSLISLAGLSLLAKRRSR